MWSVSGGVCLVECVECVWWSVQCLSVCSCGGVCGVCGGVCPPVVWSVEWDWWSVFSCGGECGVCVCGVCLVECVWWSVWSVQCWMSRGAEVVLTGNEKVLSKGPGGRTTLVSRPLLALPYFISSCFTLSLPSALVLSLSPSFRGGRSCLSYVHSHLASI